MSDINALFQKAAGRAARQREGKRAERRDPVRSRKDAPSEGAVAEGERLAIGDDHEGTLRHFLHGRPLSVGDTVELYTNRANGWIRGRYEWSGRRDDRPRLAINIWNPHGERDADGLPPWAGEIDAAIPKNGVCRLPAAVSGDRSGAGG